jgi:RHS repeat-associated protein
VNDIPLWQSYDGYAPTEGERVIHLPADALLEIRNCADRNIQSTGYIIRFKQLDAVVVTYDERTIQYTYDALSRLIEANYNNGAEIFTYGFDLAGNLTNLNGTSRTYNVVNQMTYDGTNTLMYDANGNLTDDSVNAYSWDRANRLLSMGGISYAYNGDGNRIQQDALKYILDLQPGLAQVIGDSDGNRFVHSPRGIHAVNDGAAWTYPLTDALGSVRGYANENSAVLSNVNYTPIGVPDTNIAGPAFTGEWRSENETQYHRARHLSPSLGTWLSLDPFEGMTDRPMSLNGYAWVEGNVVNATDASGKCLQTDVCANLPIWLRWLCEIPNQIPVPTLTPCGMRDNNGVNVLAATAITESDGFGPLTQDNAAVAALMVMQVNTFIATNGANWRELGTWTGAGRSPATIVADPTQTRILDIATHIVNGYCSNPSDPMALVNQSYPNIAGNQCLQDIAGNQNARFEISIDATRAADFRADSNYPLKCVFEAPGADRAIVVGGVEITRAWLGYQCAVGEQAVLARDPNTITNALSATGNYSCTPCTTVNQWWWRIPTSLSADIRNQIGTQIGQQISVNQQFVRTSNSQGNNLNNRYGGGLYVASCS